MGQARSNWGTVVFQSCSNHFVNSLKVSRRPTPGALVVASTIEIFVMVHLMGKDLNLAAPAAEGDP